MPRNFIFVSPGERYGRLQVVSLATLNGRKAANCKCDCGSCGVFLAKSLSNGNTSSCGCLVKEIRKTCSVTHGDSRSDEYTAWQHMIGRCLNNKNKSYSYYGGRGIRVVNEWIGRDGYSRFLSDMGRRPGKYFSLDRIDVNGDYCKANCRWATKSQQSNNTRSNVRITDGTKIATLAEWCRELGVPYFKATTRFHRGCSADDILFKGNLKQDVRTDNQRFWFVTDSDRVDEEVVLPGQRQRDQRAHPKGNVSRRCDHNQARSTRPYSIPRRLISQK